MGSQQVGQNKSLLKNIECKLMQLSLGATIV